MLINLDKFRTNIVSYWDASTFWFLLWCIGTKSLLAGSMGTSEMEGDKHALGLFPLRLHGGLGSLLFCLFVCFIFSARDQAKGLLPVRQVSLQKSDIPSPL